MYRKNNRFYLYLLPAFTILLIFVIFPIFNTIWLSFQDTQGNFSLETYQYVFSQEKFIKAITNTVIFALIVTPITLSVSLFLSYLLSLKIKFKNTFQTIYFLPYVTSTIAIGSVWALMYHSNYGIFNQILNSLGFESIPFLTDGKYAMLSLVIFGIWKGLAFNILLLFTAISSIDTNLEKAALIDGTSNLKTFIKIKLPQIYPVLVYLIVIGLIHSLKVYEEVVSLFGPTTAGPDNAGITIVYFTQSLIGTDQSAAAVAAVSLLVLTSILTLVNRKLTSKMRKGGQ